MMTTIWCKKQLDTFPERMITPTELSSLASLNAQISSLIVNGRKAFRLSGLLIAIYKKAKKQENNDQGAHVTCKYVTH